MVKTHWRRGKLVKGNEQSTRNSSFCQTKGGKPRNIFV